MEKIIQKKIEQAIEKQLGIYDGNHQSEGKRIVILNRGWVAVGDFSRNGDMCRLINASVIRSWGTTRGLGQLVDGPTPETKTDPIGDIDFHILTTVAIMEVKDASWK